MALEVLSKANVKKIYWCMKFKWMGGGGGGITADITSTCIMNIDQ